MASFCGSSGYRSFKRHPIETDNAKLLSSRLALRCVVAQRFLAARRLRANTPREPTLKAAALELFRAIRWKLERQTTTTAFHIVG